MAYTLVNSMAALRWAGRVAVLKSFNPVHAVPCASIYNKAKIGNREIVGFGLNGSYIYFDRMDFPYPAIRFQEFKGDLAALREKEKGDWKKLSIEEKKKLYRASFCQTFVEMDRSYEGEWKGVIGCGLLVISTGLWLFIILKKFVMGPLPKSCWPEYKDMQLATMIQMRVDPIDGLSSNYDYDKDEWKPNALRWWQIWRL